MCGFGAYPPAKCLIRLFNFPHAGSIILLSHSLDDLSYFDLVVWMLFWLHASTRGWQGA